MNSPLRSVPLRHVESLPETGTYLPFGIGPNKKCRLNVIPAAVMSVMAEQGEERVLALIGDMVRRTLKQNRVSQPSDARPAAREILVTVLEHLKAKAEGPSNGK
jgi:hypothetical protein